MAREKRGRFKDGVYQEYGIYVKIPSVEEREVRSCIDECDNSNNCCFLYYSDANSAECTLEEYIIEAREIPGDKCRSHYTVEEMKEFINNQWCSEHFKRE